MMVAKLLSADVLDWFSMVSVKGWESHKFLMASQPTLPNDSPPRNSQPDDQDLIKIGFP